jgi:hypothetical protein
MKKLSRLRESGGTMIQSLNLAITEKVEQKTTRRLKEWLRFEFQHSVQIWNL